MTQTTTTTYTKLHTGAWGVRGPAAIVKTGATITVLKRDGSRKQERIAKVLWTDGQIALAAIGLPAPADGSHRSRTGEHVCRECHGPLVDARHHRAMGGLCGDCAFDEYDC